jgi:hypothetical protein
MHIHYAAILQKHGRILYITNASHDKGVPLRFMHNHYGLTYNNKAAKVITGEWC